MKQLFITIILISVVYSCNQIIDNVMFSRPNKKDFEAIIKPPYGIKNSNLLYDGFYFNNTIVPTDSNFYTYLAFKKEGLVVYFSNTSMQPDTLAVWDKIWNPELKKSGIPKPDNCDFGFYKGKNDSIIASVHVAGLSYWDYYKISGLVFKDSLLLDIEKLGVGSHTEKWVYKQLVFKPFKCKVKPKYKN